MDGSAPGGVVTSNALLVPDCGAGVGLGHLERMLALADALRPDVDQRIVVPREDAGLHSRVAARGHATVHVGGDARERALGAAAETAPDLIVLDGYFFDTGTQRLLRERGALVVVDDLGHPTTCNLAVNPAPGGEAKRPAGADAFLGGATYALLSAATVAARDSVAPGGRDGRSVLVSTGATDRDGLCARLVTALLAGDAGVEVVAIVGPEMRRDGLGGDPRLSILVEPPTLAGALGAATVYAGAAGTSAVQAACVGVPAVITATAANQADQAAALAAAGCAVVAPPDEIAAECVRLLDAAELRAEMSRRGRALVDGQGAARVAQALRRLMGARAA
jgi:spore coat polysaccharide biosynthesis predicted glycosyltransferase SpsG